MDQQHLLDFIARSPGTIGQRIGRQVAVGMIAGGRVEAAGALVDLMGLSVLPALAAAGAPAPALRRAIETALLERCRELPAFIAANGGRPAFASWCRQAAFTLPAELPEVVSLYHGTMGVSPQTAATGLHWSLSFDDAAHYACGFADAALTGVIVLHARVSRDGIACIVSTSAHSEVVPVEAPTDFEVITDHQRIGDAAVRRHHELAPLLDKGWIQTGAAGAAEAVIRGQLTAAQAAAHATRARMAAAGVPRGAAIVA